MMILIKHCANIVKKYKNNYKIKELKEEVKMSLIIIYAPNFFVN